jgi:hypothetical protein
VIIEISADERVSTILVAAALIALIPFGAGDRDEPQNQDQAPHPRRLRMLDHRRLTGI